MSEIACETMAAPKCQPSCRPKTRHTTPPHYISERSLVSDHEKSSVAWLWCGHSTPYCFFRGVILKDSVVCLVFGRRLTLVGRRTKQVATPRRRPPRVAQDAAYCYSCSVVCVRLSVRHTSMRCAEKAEPIQIGMWSGLGELKEPHSIPTGSGTFRGHMPKLAGGRYSQRYSLGGSSDATSYSNGIVGYKPHCRRAPIVKSYSSGGANV